MTSRRTRERLVKRLQELGIASPFVLEIIRLTPRHLFVDEALSHLAYEDTALPIGHGQTISRPYMVARMTELLLQDGPLESVLEVGTGSGYQTVVLSQLVGKVCSVERLKALQEKARKRLRMLKRTNVSLRCADGVEGWPSQAPFDGILVTAAPSSIPEDLIGQLAVGGRMVIPIGDEEGMQELKRIVRTGRGYDIEMIETVNFVPMKLGTT